MSESSGTRNDLVVLGKVAKAHGIKGEIKIFPYSSQPENFDHYEKIFIVAANEVTDKKYFIEKTRMHGKYALVVLRGCKTRNDAENLVGAEVAVLRSDLPELDEDEFYLTDLVGKTVVTTDSKVLGRVSGIMQTRGHDIIAVQHKDSEYLIPATNEFMVRFDDNEVLVKLPPGLMEINKS